MKTMTIAILGGAAAVAVGIAAIVSRGGGAEAESRAFFESLMPRVNDVASVEIRRSDSGFTVRRNGDRWELADKGGYPVRVDRVRETVVGLAELRAAEPMTAREERYANIGVQDLEKAPAAEPTGAGPTFVILKDDGGAVLASVIVGNQRFGARPGVYLRRPGEAQSWLAEGRLEIPGQFTGWIDPQILSVSRDRVKSVQVVPAQGEPFSLERESREQRNYTVIGVPDGKEISSTTAPDAFGNALSFLSLEDVAPAGAIEFSGGGNAVRGSHLEFRTFDGMLIMVQLADKEGRTWARMAAMPDPEAEPSAEVVQEAAEINAKVEPWAFGLPPYKASVMKVTMQDMLQDGRPIELPASMQEEGIEMLDMESLVPAGAPGEPGAP